MAKRREKGSSSVADAMTSAISKSEQIGEAAGQRLKGRFQGGSAGKQGALAGAAMDLGTMVATSMFKNFVAGPIKDIDETINQPVARSFSGQPSDISPGSAVLAGAGSGSPALALKPRTGMLRTGMGSGSDDALKGILSKLKDAESAVANAEAKGYTESLPELRKKARLLRSQAAEARRKTKYMREDGNDTDKTTETHIIFQSTTKAAQGRAAINPSQVEMRRSLRSGSGRLAYVKMEDGRYYVFDRPEGFHHDLIEELEKKYPGLKPLEKGNIKLSDDNKTILKAAYHFDKGLNESYHYEPFDTRPAPQPAKPTEIKEFPQESYVLRTMTQRELRDAATGGGEISKAARNELARRERVGSHDPTRTANRNVYYGLSPEEQKTINGLMPYMSPRKILAHFEKQGASDEFLDNILRYVFKAGEIRDKLPLTTDPVFKPKTDKTPDPVPSNDN